MFVKLAVFACSLALAACAYNGPLAGGVPAAQFPAGIDPQSCPNYPDCANPAVAVNQVPVNQYNQQQPQYNPAPQQYQPQPQQYQAPQQPQYNPAPQYQPQYQPQYNPAPQQRAQYSPGVQNALDRGEYIGDGDYHGEGLAEALAPGYQGQPQAYNAAPAYNPAPQAYNPAPAAYNPGPPAGGQPAQVPAGVDARSCPNYPFCH